MISLTEDQIGPNYLGHYVLKEAPKAMRSIVAVELISAAFDLLVFSRRACGNNYPDWQPVAPRIWRLGDCIFRYHGSLKNRDIRAYRHPKKGLWYRAFVLGNRRKVFAAAASALLKKPPDVQAVEDFVSLRLALSSLDMSISQSWSFRQTIHKLLDLFNQRIANGPYRLDLTVHHPMENHDSLRERPTWSNAGRCIYQQ